MTGRPRSTQRLRIVVAGLIAQHPETGGLAWHYGQYLLGLRLLGHDVFYVEDSGEWPYNRDGGSSGQNWIARDCIRNTEHLARTLSYFGLPGRWSYRFPVTGEWFGLPDDERRDVLASADLLINVSGALEHPEHYRRIELLVYIDTDPIFTQVKIEGGELDFAARVAAHDVHFTYGERLDEAGITGGHAWRSTRQPVVLAEWPQTDDCRETFTTVMNWTSFKPLSLRGRMFAQKDLEFDHFVTLPRRLPGVEFEIALGSVAHDDWQSGDAPAGVVAHSLNTRRGRSLPDVLRSAGWAVVDAGRRCAGLHDYRSFIATSKGEWSVAKHGYVSGQPGWFSERSACYLAAGRPVVVQDTGFVDVLPTGLGILPFRTLEEAVAAVEEVRARYDRHAAAAREIAASCFESGVVLDRLLEEAMRDHGI